MNEKELRAEVERLETKAYHLEMEKEEQEEDHRLEVYYLKRRYQAYEGALSLEIEGMEDILAFIPVEARAPVRERLQRMRRIMDDMREEKI